MDFELDLSSENMTSFLELEQEIQEAATSLPQHLLRPSVIVKPRPKPAVQSSPSSIHSDIQLDQNQELIEELEEFFIKTEGCATVVDEIDQTEQLSLSSSLVTPEGQKVII